MAVAILVIANVRFVGDVARSTHWFAADAPMAAGVGGAWSHVTPRSRHATATNTASTQPAMPGITTGCSIIHAAVSPGAHAANTAAPTSTRLIVVYHARRLAAIAKLEKVNSDQRQNHTDNPPAARISNTGIDPNPPLLPLGTRQPLLCVCADRQLPILMNRHTPDRRLRQVVTSQRVRYHVSDLAPLLAW